MEKREKTLFQIAGILFIVACVNDSLSVLSVAQRRYSVNFLDIFSLLSICFMAVVLLMKRKDKLLCIALGVYTIISFVWCARLLVYGVFKLNGFLEFLIPALLCAVIILEKQISAFKKPILLICTYLSTAFMLITIINYENLTVQIRWWRYTFWGCCGYFNLFPRFIGTAIIAFGFICISSILTNNVQDEKYNKLNKIGKIGFIFLPAGVILGLLIAFISYLIYDHVYFFDGYFFTGVLWIIVIALVVVGICLSPLAILYPAKPRIVTNNDVKTNDITKAGYISLSKHIVLCLFTFGIWNWIWIYRTTAYLNRTPNAEQYNPTSQLLLCIFAPFYSIYWYYKHGGRIDELSRSKNLNQSDMATMCLILGIFIPIVACIIMQDRINSLCTATNHSNNFSASQQEEKTT